MSTNWKGKVVLLTGASSGIGRGLAVAMGSYGATVGLLARRAEELNHVADAVAAAGGTALVLPADVTDAGAFDFDDPGSQVCEAHCRDGAGQELAEVEDKDPVERSVCLGRHSALL